MEYVSRYSLAGILSSSTGPQESLIKRIEEVAARDDRILAAYLVGGFAVGTGDAWSDVDAQFVIRDDAEESFRDSWRDVADELAHTAHVQSFGGVIGGTCITDEWLHFDVVFNPQSKIDAKAVEGMVPLLDKEGVLPDAPVPRPGRQSDPFYPESAVEHFLYMLGNMVSVIARNEVVPASNGVIIVRDIDLVGLFLAEQGWVTTREHAFGNPFPFTKRLRSYLTDEQNAMLESLPPVAASIDSVIDGYVALASIFLPRARAMADRTGAIWPAAFEEASVGFFERSLGVEISF